MTVIRRLAPILIAAPFLVTAAQAEVPDPGVSPASAAAPHPGHHHRRGGFGHVLAKLNLNSEQKVQVRAIFAQSKAQFVALHDRSRTNLEQLAVTAPGDPSYEALLAQEKSDAASRIQLRSDVWTQIYAVLTPEQQAQIPGIVTSERAAREARRAQWKANHPTPA